MNLSYTAIHLYEQCPYRYRVERVDRRIPPPSEPLLVGSTAHLAIAEYLRHLIAEDLQTDVTWWEEAVSRAEAKAREEGLFLSPKQCEQVSEIVEFFVGSHLFHPSRIVGVELPLEIELESATFRAVIDLLEIEDGAPVVRDWKTSWAVPSSVQEDLQLRIYAWMVCERFGYDEVRCELDFVRHGAVRRAEFGPEDHEQTERRVTRTMRLIAGETSWRATPGSHCAGCPWANDCPAITDDVLAIKSREDAARFAGEILVLEKQVENRRELLRAWCAEEGPVEVGGEVFGHLASRDGGWTVTDKPAFAAILEQHGLNPWDYFHVSFTKLKQIRTAQKWRGLLAEVEPLLKREVRTMFTHRGMGE